MYKFCPYCGSKVDKQSKNGFQCSNCKKWTHYSSVPTASVIVKVGKEVLLVVRAIEPAKGELDIPGGFLKYGEDPKKGAIREFKEEVGIEFKSEELKFLGIWVDTYYYQREDQFCFNVVYLVELDKKFEGKPADDVAKLVWIPLSDNPKFAFSYLHKIWDKLKKS